MAFLIKGGSVLTFLSDILVNLPWSVVIDVMHQSHEGVAKAILKVIKKQAI